MVGLELPIIPVRHEYFITEPTVPPTIYPNFPVMRIPGKPRSINKRFLYLILFADATLYLRADVNGLLLGGWEPNGLSLDPRSFSINHKPPHIAEDWSVLSQFGTPFSSQTKVVLPHIFYRCRTCTHLSKGKRARSESCIFWLAHVYS